MADALEETGWWDERCDELTSAAGVSPRKYSSFPNVYLPVDVKSIAAVLLFGEWSTEMWPVVKKCKRRVQYVDGWLEIDGRQYSLRDLRMGPVHVNVRIR